MLPEDGSSSNFFQFYNPYLNHKWLASTLLVEIHKTFKTFSSKLFFPPVSFFVGNAPAPCDWCECSTPSHLGVKLGYFYFNSQLPRTIQPSIFNFQHQPSTFNLQLCLTFISFSFICLLVK